MRQINPEKEIEHIINVIKRYFIENGNKDTKAVIGISGGKDSTVAAALLTRALGSDRVIGVLMPCGKQTDIEDSYEVVKMLKIPFVEINLHSAYEAMEKNLVDNNIPINDQIKTNMPARLRMTTLYNVAAAVGGRVINTGNASELYVGYTTKYGDLAGDFAIFRDYYVRDVLSIGAALEEIAEPRLLYKDPGDGMSGKTDEDNMGFSYETLDAYLLDGIYPDYDTLRNIEERHDRNKHKRAIKIPCIWAATRSESDDCSF